MREFPVELKSELLEIFSSKGTDPLGEARPFSGDWEVQSVSIGPSKTRLTLRVAHPAGLQLRLTMNSCDFEVPEESGPETPHSRLAYELSMIIEEEVFTRDASEFELEELIVKQHGIEVGVKKQNLGSLLNDKGITDFHLVRDKENRQ